jgi:hypothetical protein
VSWRGEVPLDGFPINVCQHGLGEGSLRLLHA